MTDKPLVGVIGANSLVGDGLLPLLAAQGKSVAAFSRHVEAHCDKPGISWLTLGAAIPTQDKIQLWISLGPIWVLSDYFAWLSASGARQVVALSSTSRFTKVDSSDPAEQMLAERFADGEEKLASWAESHGIAWTVLRPTLIYGLGRDKNVSVIARMIRRFGFFPLLGEGRGLRQPIHLEDLASACAAALEQPAAYNRAFNVSGGETLSYRDMVARIFTVLGKRPRFIRIPLWMFRLAVKAMRVLPPFHKWSSAMVERMNRDMVFDHAKATQALGFSPRDFLLRSDDLPR